MSDCPNCNKLLDELAQVKAAKKKADDAMIKYANRILLIKRLIAEAEAAPTWMEK